MADETLSRSRRAFNASALALGVASLAGGLRIAGAGESADTTRADSWQERLAAARKLFCIAYITPSVPNQAGQEAMVARYPLAVVPQDNRPMFRRWRDDVRNRNPDIVMLGYQITIEEGTVPGPGHDILRLAQDCWVTDNQGKAFTIGTPDKKRRVYDPRKRQWRDRFVEACSAIMEADRFEGLFLDQCTIYDRASPDAGVRKEMRAALEEALTELRKQQPKALIVANSSFSLPCVNGELNESRPERYATELSPHERLDHPRVDLAHVVLEKPADRAALKQRLLAAQSYGAFFGASRDYQHVEWYPEFDELPSVPKPPRFESTAGDAGATSQCGRVA